MDEIITDNLWVGCTRNDTRKDGVKYRHYRFWTYYNGKAFRVAFRNSDAEVQAFKERMQNATDRLLPIYEGKCSYPVNCTFIKKEYVDHIAYERNTIIIISLQKN